MLRPSFRRLRSSTPRELTPPRNKLISNNSPLYGPELDRVAANGVEEYNLNIEGIKEAFKGFLYNVSADRPQEDILSDLARMIKMKIQSPKRPPRVMILGPPGSGRSS